MGGKKTQQKKSCSAHSGGVGGGYKKRYIKKNTRPYDTRGCNSNDIAHGFRLILVFVVIPPLHCHHGISLDCSYWRAGKIVCFYSPATIHTPTHTRRARKTSQANNTHTLEKKRVIGPEKERKKEGEGEKEETRVNCRSRVWYLLG